jgi:hypothetical protein
MRYGPPFRYADREDGRRVAYQVVGDGDLDLVFLFGWPTHLGLMWENPSCASFLRGLSSFSRLLLYDRVGGGLSDRGQTGYVFEDEMDDVRAVMAATGSRRAALFGCHTGGRVADVRASRSMAERIPGARMVELPGDDHLPFFGDQDTVVELTQEFLTGARPVVDSTRLAAEMEDRRWHRVLVEYQEVVRQQLVRFRGREIKTTGDGFLATFDGPARAIRAADAIRAGLRDLELEIRAGLHTGECELYAVELAER